MGGRKKKAEEILNRLDFSSSLVLFNGILKTENYKLIRNREKNKTVDLAFGESERGEEKGSFAIRCKIIALTIFLI